MGLAAPRQLRVHGTLGTATALGLEMLLRSEGTLHVELRDQDGTKLLCVPGRMIEVCKHASGPVLAVEVEATALLVESAKEAKRRELDRQQADAERLERDIVRLHQRGMRVDAIAEHTGAPKGTVLRVLGRQR